MFCYEFVGTYEKAALRSDKNRSFAIVTKGSLVEDYRAVGEVGSKKSSQHSNSAQERRYARVVVSVERGSKHVRSATRCTLYSTLPRGTYIPLFQSTRANEHI